MAEPEVRCWCARHTGMVCVGGSLYDKEEYVCECSCVCHLADTLVRRIRKGIEEANRGETVDRGDFSQYLEASDDG